MKRGSLAILAVIGVLLFIFGCTADKSATKPFEWQFKEIVVDENPLQPNRVTDCDVVDIDNDGKPDLWFSGRAIAAGDFKFAWYRNTGDIDNWSRQTPFEGSSIGSAWGDVDNDGDLDLITGRDRGNQPFVWMENPLNDGGSPKTDTWKVYRIHPDPADPDEVHTSFNDINGRKIAHLDLNRDGRLDIVIAAFKQTLWYVPGPKDPKQGPWIFHKLVEEEGGHGGTCVGDVDNDGDLDVVWGNSWYDNPGDPTKIPWNRHIIDDEWALETQVELADMNKDGWIDIVLTGEESTHGVAWYANPGTEITGMWLKHQVISGWEGLHSLELADFDGDCDLDIVTAEMHHTETKRVAIFENIDPVNTWEVHLLSTSGTHKAKIADVDNDGDPDIVGKNYGDDIRPKIWINPNNNTLSLDSWSRKLIDAENGSRYMIRAGDMDLDSRVDIITGTGWYKNPGDPMGNWQRGEFGEGLGTTHHVYDIDLDGDLDVFGDGFGWVRNDRNGQFTLLHNIDGTGGFAQGSGIAHFYLDGPLQIAYTYKNGDDIRMLTVPADPSTDRWQDEQIYDWQGLSKSIDVDDIDNDGDNDIMFTGRDGKTIQWLQNNGKGRFIPIDIGKAPAQINHRCHLGDIDRDGKLDVAIGHKGRLVTWFEQGEEATAEWKMHIIADSTQLDFDPLSIDIADMDRDGDPDIVVGEHTPDETKLHLCRLHIFENTSSDGLNWKRHIIHKGDEHHQGAQVYDIDGDGDPDILSVGWRHPMVLLYINKAIP